MCFLFLSFVLAFSIPIFLLFLRFFFPIFQTDPLGEVNKEQVLSGVNHICNGHCYLADHAKASNCKLKPNPLELISINH